MMIFFGDVVQNMMEAGRALYDATTDDEIAAASDAIMAAATDFIMYCGILAAATFLVTYVSVVIFSLTCVRQVCVHCHIHWWG